MALHFNAESEKASSTASLQRSRMSSQLPASQAANGTKDSQKKRTNHEIPQNRRLRRPGGHPGTRIAQATSGALKRSVRASGGGGFRKPTHTTSHRYRPPEGLLHNAARPRNSQRPPTSPTNHTQP